MVNRMGFTFAQRMQEATGECVGNIAKAYVATIKLFDIEHYWQEVEKLDGRVSVEMQHQMFAQIARLVRRSTRWLLRTCRSNLNALNVATRFKLSAEFLLMHAGGFLAGDQKVTFNERLSSYIAAGVSKELSRFIVSARYLYTTFTLQRIAEQTDRSLAEAAQCYFELGERLSLNWFADQILTMFVDNYWQALARESFRDELESHQADLTGNWLKHGYDATEIMSYEQWTDNYQSYIERWQTMMNELLATNDTDMAMFPVALRFYQPLLKLFFSAAGKQAKLKRETQYWQ